MNVLILNPEFPKDKSKARALTKEQFEHVHDYIVEQMNSGKKIRDNVIINMLETAKMPIDFSPFVTCKVCKKELKQVTLHTDKGVPYTQWKAKDDELQSMAQYCMADPAAGSSLHEPQ